MPKLSPHRLKGKIIRIRRGLALYQTYASPFYFARILDARNQRYKVRSTKETNRVEARKVADEYAHQITSRDAPADREFSFKTYANRFIQKGRQLAQSQVSATRTISAQPVSSSTTTIGAWSVTLEHGMSETSPPAIGSSSLRSSHASAPISPPRPATC